MKAAVVEQPGVLVVKDLPPPQVGDYDALVQMLYGATCTGTDQHLIHGRFAWPIKYPTILGHESIGRVIELGRKVRHYKKGDLVTRVGTPAPPGGQYTVSWGGFAELSVESEQVRDDARGVIDADDGDGLAGPVGRDGRGAEGQGVDRVGVPDLGRDEPDRPDRQQQARLQRL